MGNECMCVPPVSYLRCISCGIFVVIFPLFVRPLPRISRPMHRLRFFSLSRSIHLNRDFCHFLRLYSGTPAHNLRAQKKQQNRLYSRHKLHFQIHRPSCMVIFETPAIAWLFASNLSAGGKQLQTSKRA